MKKVPEEVRGNKDNLRPDINLKRVSVLFIYFNPNDNFDAGVDGWVFMLADFGEAACFVLLAIPATYSGNAIW